MRVIAMPLVVCALSALAWAASLILPAGAAPAVAATDVSLSEAGARVAVGSGQVSVVLQVDNPKPGFPGWVEIRGVERRVLCAVEVPAGASELHVWASLGDLGGGFSVRLLDASERPVSSSRDLLLDYGLSILVVGAESADYAFLADVLGMRVEPAASFPVDAREYDLHAAVVLAEPDQAALGAAAAPLLSWVDRGGLLVWAVGDASAWAPPEETDWAAVPASPLEQVAVSEPTPILVSVMGSESVPLAQPGLEAGRQVTVLTATGDDPPLVYTLADGSPIMVAAPQNLGDVAVAGLVPTGDATDDAADTGLSQFWQSLLAGAGLPVPAATTSEGAAPHGFVTGRVPSLSVTVGLSLAYVAMVGVGLFASLRRLRRRDAVWWALPLLVAVCTAGVLAAGLALRGASPRLVTRLNIVAPPEGAAPIAYRAVGAYAPFGAVLGFPLPPAAYPGPPPAGGLVGLEGTYTVRQQGTDAMFEGVRVAPGSGRTVIYGIDEESVSSASGGGSGDDMASAEVEGTAWPWRLNGQREGDAVTWTVTNTSERELRRVTLLADGLWALPDLPPGGGVRFTLSQGQMTDGDGRRIEAQPRPADTEDLLEWDASRRLRDEWWTWGGPEGPVAPAIPAGGAAGGEVLAPAVWSPTEARLLAWADDEEPAIEVDGFAAGSNAQGIVVFEAVLR